jgi:hypothetical protein
MANTNPSPLKVYASAVTSFSFTPVSKCAHIFPPPTVRHRENFTPQKRNKSLSRIGEQLAVAVRTRAPCLFVFKAVLMRTLMEECSYGPQAMQECKCAPPRQHSIVLTSHVLKFPALFNRKVVGLTSLALSSNKCSRALTTRFVAATRCCSTPF